MSWQCRIVELDGRLGGCREEVGRWMPGEVQPRVKRERRWWARRRVVLRAVAGEWRDACYKSRREKRRCAWSFGILEA